jgi:hypothetical protein
VLPGFIWGRAVLIWDNSRIFRRKGIAQRLCIEAIEGIKKAHSIKALFFWAFSKEGEKLAEKIAGLIDLPLYKR